MLGQQMQCAGPGITRLGDLATLLSQPGILRMLLEARRMDQRVALATGQCLGLQGGIATETLLGRSRRGHEDASRRLPVSPRVPVRRPRLRVRIYPAVYPP